MADQKRQKAERAGRWAELWVMLFMMAKGFWPVARRWRCPMGELDLIVRNRRFLVGVEVKFRTGAGADQALESLARHGGLDRQRRSLDVFMKGRGDVVGLAPRLDVVVTGGPFSFRHFEGV